MLGSTFKVVDKGYHPYISCVGLLVAKEHSFAQLPLGGIISVTKDKNELSGLRTL